MEGIIATIVMILAALAAVVLYCCLVVASRESRREEMNYAERSVGMANKSEDHLVQCPYYKTNTSQVVYCEGLEDGMVIHLAFATHAQLIDYKGRFCRRSCWRKCPLAKILNQKWDYSKE